MADYTQDFNDSLSALNTALGKLENRSSSIKASYDANTIKELSKYMKELPSDLREMAETALNDQKKANDEFRKKQKEEREEADRKLLAGVNNSLTTRTVDFIRKTEDVFTSFKDGLMSGLTSLATTFANVTRGLESSLDSTINTFINAQERFYYGLNGLSGGARANYSSIMGNFSSVMGGQNYVNQQAMFQNMAALVSNGIISDVEQKAFLQTLANDFGMKFRADDSMLTRLVRIQHEDYTANRLAIEYSLKEFLNQNYKTSEYIREGFTGVSNALLKSQSLMSSSLAASYEATVQTWLGSYYSAGVDTNTVNNLARAIDKIGSGNIEGLGTPGDASTLLLMGASRMGMNIGDLLNGGYTSEQDINKLMTGVSQYLVDMGANSSNVVKNQLGRVFGVDISDIAAIANNGINFTGGANANAGYALSGMTGLVPETTRLNNTFDNFFFDWGSRLASDTNRLRNYMINKRIIEPIGGMISGIGAALSGSGLPGVRTAGAITNLLGLGMQNANLFTLIPALFSGEGSAIGDFFGNVGSSTGWWGGGNGLLDIYNALGKGSNQPNIIASNAGVSGSVAISKSGDYNNLLSNSKFSTNSALSDMGVNIEGTEEDQYDATKNIDTNVGLIVDLLTTTNSNVSDIKNRLDNLYSFGGLVNA